MKKLLPDLTLIAVLLSASCSGAVTSPASSPTSAPTVAPTTATAKTVAPTATATASAPATTAAPSSVFAASECTSATATTRQVIERYLALSTSNDPKAVLDCFAKVWRERNATGVNVNTFTDFAAAWSKAGPVTNVTITFIDTVNGCDRFGVGAQLPNPPNPSAFVYQVPPFFTVGPEAGRPRIFETGTALVNASAATTRCQ